MDLLMLFWEYEMEALAVKQQMEVEQRMPVQVAESLRYARKEPADMPVLVVDSSLKPYWPLS